MVESEEVGQGERRMSAKCRPSRYLASECVLRHVLVLIDDTLASLMISMKGGGFVGDILYDDCSCKTGIGGKLMERIEDCQKWMSMALETVGYTGRTYRLTHAERALINDKIRSVNRWFGSWQGSPWTGLTVQLAALNLALFWIRLLKTDNVTVRTVYIKVDDLCVRIGSGNEWMLSEDLFNACRKTLLTGCNAGNLRSEEEYFLRFIALPMARNGMEEGIIREQGNAPTAAELLAV